jgi:hypothetical protein
VEGIDLLRPMEQSVDEEFLDQETEGNELLSEEVVENISKAKESRLRMELCDKRKSKEPTWGLLWWKGREGDRIMEVL